MIFIFVFSYTSTSPVSSAFSIETSEIKIPLPVSPTLPRMSTKRKNGSSGSPSGSKKSKPEVTNPFVEMQRLASLFQEKIQEAYNQSENLKTAMASAEADHVTVINNLKGDLINLQNALEVKNQELQQASVNLGAQQKVLELEQALAEANHEKETAVNYNREWFKKISGKDLEISTLRLSVREKEEEADSANRKNALLLDKLANEASRYKFLEERLQSLEASQSHTPLHDE